MMLRILITVALPILMLADTSSAHGQQTDPFEFPPEIILDKDSMAAKGIIEEGLAAHRDRLDSPCADQDCYAENARSFVLFLSLIPVDWPEERFHSLMREARGYVERVEGVKRHDLMFYWYLVDGNHAGDTGDLRAYENALNAQREEIAHIRAEGDEHASLAKDNEIIWLTNWASLKEARNETDAAIEILQQALDLTRQKPDMARNDPVHILLRLGQLFAKSDPARSKKYTDEACELYQPTFIIVGFDENCPGPYYQD